MTTGQVSCCELADVGGAASSPNETVAEKQFRNAAASKSFDLRGPICCRWSPEEKNKGCCGRVRALQGLRPAKGVQATMGRGSARTDKGGEWTDGVPHDHGWALRQIV